MSESPRATRKSMKGHQPQASKNVSWVTPKWILDALGEFDLDPCTPDEMPWETALRRYTKFDDGLIQPWEGRVWLNPPFDKRGRWSFLKRMVEHGNGIALVSASTETEWFKEWVWKEVHEGRLDFTPGRLIDKVQRLK